MDKLILVDGKVYKRKKRIITGCSIVSAVLFTILLLLFISVWLNER